MKILQIIKKLKAWIIGFFIISAALAAPLIIPNGGVEGVDVFIDEKQEVIDKNITVTKKTLNLIEASGEVGLSTYTPEQKNIETEFTYKGATHTVTIDFAGYNGCRGSGLGEATCTFHLNNQIKSNIQWAVEGIDGQVKPTDRSSEVVIGDLNLVK